MQCAAGDPIATGTYTQWRGRWPRGRSFAGGRAPFDRIQKADGATVEIILEEVDGHRLDRDATFAADLNDCTVITSPDVANISRGSSSARSPASRDIRIMYDRAPSSRRRSPNPPAGASSSAGEPVEGSSSAATQYVTGAVCGHSTCSSIDDCICGIRDAKPFQFLAVIIRIKEIPVNRAASTDHTR